MADALPARLGAPKAPPEWGFDSLICCRANRLPFAAARALIEGDAKHSSLLILIGQSKRSYAGADAEAAHLQCAEQ